MFCPSAFARGENGGQRGGGRYYYHGDNWYRHGWFGWGVLVPILVIGAIIESLPPRHETVIIEGTPYYRDERYYYKELPDGNYVVVPPPAVIQPQPVTPVPQTPDTSTVNIPNSKGGYTSVTLRRSGNGFVGPQGEYYPTYPTVKQLQNMYGN